MTQPESPKDVLHRYLQRGREALLWKLDGVSEYDARRPLTATGSNLLGLVKHVAYVDAGYLGEVFDRPFPEDLPDYSPDAEINADMWARPDETRADIVDLYRRVWAHGDATVAALDLSSEGSVPWWPKERRVVTLQQILVHLIAETHRHAGHADILREQVDGFAGLNAQFPNLPETDVDWWTAYVQRLEEVARRFGGPEGE